MKRGRDFRVKALFFSDDLMAERIIETLPNGLRIIAEKSSGNVAYIGVLTNAGSRDDSEGCDGLAHFVEHTLFKGTASRNSWQISNRMESVGGELNAYTTKEEIMLYTNAPSGYERRAVELLADLVEKSEFPAVELDRERGVILEEIHSYRDNASYAVFDEFDELFFAGSGLAHNILGYAESVKNIKSQDALDFRQKHFVPDNMVFYCVAPSDPIRNIDLIKRYFGHLKGSHAASGRIAPVPNPEFDEQRDRHNHQANVLIGTHVFDASDPRRYPLILLANYLGGPAMNSVLNRELRDKRGLVYTVETNIALYSDAGAYQLYFGCEPDNVGKCIRIFRKELEKLASSRMSDRMFNMARRQLCGQLLVSGDNRESRAMGYAKSLMRYGEVRDNTYTTSRLMEVTPEEVRDIASMIASQPMSKLILI